MSWMLFALLALTINNPVILDSLAATDYLQSQPWIDRPKDDPLIIENNGTLAIMYEANPLALRNGRTVRSAMPILMHIQRENDTLRRIATAWELLVVWSNNEGREAAGLSKYYAIGYTWSW